MSFPPLYPELLLPLKYLRCPNPESKWNWKLTNRSIPFAIAKENPNSEIISKFGWTRGNEDFHCFHLTLYLFPKVYQSDFHTCHFNETSFTKVLWFSLGIHSWPFLHSITFYVILFFFFWFKISKTHWFPNLYWCDQSWAQNLNYQLSSTSTISISDLTSILFNKR